MDSELLLKFFGYFPDYLSALSRTLLRFCWTTFVETAVFRVIVLPTASFRKSVTSLAASLTFLPEREKGRD